MNYYGQDGQSQLPPHQQQNAPAYTRQYSNQDASLYSHSRSAPSQPSYQSTSQPYVRPQSQAQPHFEVIIPSYNPHQQFYTQSQPQHYHHPPPPQYHQPLPQSGYIYNNQYNSQPQPAYPQVSLPPLNGYNTMQEPPSSPDPLQNGYNHPPPVRQLSQPNLAPPEPVSNGHHALSQPAAQTRPSVTQQATQPEVDYAALLLSLAEEYFIAASKLASRSEYYYRLIATGMGCLDSALNNYNLEPLRYAQISLKYAQVLFDETENYDDAERVLSRAVEVCERNKFLDLKYSLQLLQACVLFQSKQKAAIKDLQTIIEDLEVYNHVAWLYALRYQLVLFHLMDDTVRDLQQALQHAEKLVNTAKHNGDKAMVVFAAALEATIHLQTSHQEAVTSAQRSITTARTALNDPSTASLLQLEFMVQLVDLCCSTRESNFEQSDQKRKRMHELFGTIMESKSWEKEGSTISVPVSQSSLRGLTLQKGGLAQVANGQTVLNFTWLDLEEAEIVGFLLSAASKARKNASDRDKIQQFIDEGLTRTRGLIKSAAKNTGIEHLQKGARARVLECQYLIEQAFLYCSCGKWKEARQTVQGLTKAINDADGVSSTLLCVTHYLSGAIEQGEGNLNAAYKIYQSSNLSIQQFSSPGNKANSSRSDPTYATRLNIALLATMNTLLIISAPDHPQHNSSSHLIDSLNTLIKSSTDKNVHAAYTLIHTHVTSRGMVISKNQLVAALNAAKAICNTQITSLVLMVMQQSFFKGQTDEHANKCVKAATVNVRQWGDSTWGYVANGIEKESLEFKGDKEGVERLKQHMEKGWEKVPEGLKRTASRREGEVSI